MNKVYRYRIYPSERQVNVLNSQLVVCAELYNAAIQERREAWARQRKNISWFDQNQQLAEIRESRSDVKNVNANVLESVLKRANDAFQGFFRRVKRGQKPGYPRFRATARYNSLTFRQIGKALNGNRLRLSKVGQVRIKLHRPIEGAIKTLTVKREADRWYALFAVEHETYPLPKNSDAIRA